MAKILVTSDLHLGRQFSGLGRSGDFVRKALKEALEKIVSHALETPVDLVAVCGNLFASNLVSRQLIDKAMLQIERLGRIPFVVVPGRGDCLDANSLFRHFPRERFPDNLRVLGLDNDSVLSLPDSEITLYGIADFGDSLPQGGWQMPSRVAANGVHVLLVGNRAAFNATDETQLNPLLQQIVTKGSFDFVAVGGNLNYRKWSETAVSPGAPEGLDFECGETGVCVLADVKSDAVVIDPVHCGELSWKRLVLDSSRFLYNIEVERELHKLADANRLVELKMTGPFSADGYLDLGALERDQARQFCYLRICDERERPEMLPINGDNLGTLVGEYSALLNDSLDKAPVELKARYLEALATGRALLSGKDVI